MGEVSKWVSDLKIWKQKVRKGRKVEGESEV